MEKLGALNEDPISRDIEIPRKDKRSQRTPHLEKHKNF